MDIKVSFDAKDFLDKIGRIPAVLEKTNQRALTDIGDEILRLSTFQVPHDTGLLQTSGKVESGIMDKNDVVVGYNKVYAARLHEHPEYHFQKGRKGKYLEDPIKLNTVIFLQHYRDVMKGVFA